MRATGWLAWLLMALGCGGSVPPVESGADESTREEGPSAPAVVIHEVPEESSPFPLFDAERLRESVGEAKGSPERALAMLDQLLQELGIAVAAFKHEGRPELRAVTTCRQYLEALEDGFYLEHTSVESVQAVGLFELCHAVGYGSRRRDARTTHLRDFTLSAGVAQLPMSLVAPGADSGATLGRSLGTPTLDARSGVVQLCPPGEDEDDRTCVSFSELGRGDFDGDGIEDLVVLTVSGSGGASSDLSFRADLLTRGRRNGRLERIELRLVPLPGP